MVKFMSYKVILHFVSKILTHAQMLLANTMQSAKRSPHLMPVVFAMTTARRTRSLCVHLTRQHSRTSVSVCWTFANAKATTRFIILEAVQVKYLGYFTLLLSCLLQNMRRSTRPDSGLSITLAPKVWLKAC